MEHLDDDGALMRIPADERGIWLQARCTIKACGGNALEAEVYAAQVADDLMAKGDMAGRRLWQRVKDRIRELRRGQSKDDTVN